MFIFRGASNCEDISGAFDDDTSYINGSKGGSHTYGWSSDLLTNMVGSIFAN